MGVALARTLTGRSDYGTDVSTFVNGDLDRNFETLTGPRVILELVLRRWTMARGEAWWEPDAGEDVRSRLKTKMGATSRWELASALEFEAAKEPAVRAASVLVLVDGQRIRIEGQIVPVTGRRFRFSFDPTTLATTVQE